MKHLKTFIKRNLSNVHGDELDGEILRQAPEILWWWNRWCIRGYNSDIWQETRMSKVQRTTHFNWLDVVPHKCISVAWKYKQVMTTSVPLEFSVEISPPGIQSRSLFWETHLEYHVTQVMIHINLLGKKVFDHFATFWILYCVCQRRVRKCKQLVALSWQSPPSLLLLGSCPPYPHLATLPTLPPAPCPPCPHLPTLSTFPTPCPHCLLLLHIINYTPVLSSSLTCYTTTSHEFWPLDTDNLSHKLMLSGSCQTVTGNMSQAGGEGCLCYIENANRWPPCWCTASLPGCLALKFSWEFWSETWCWQQPSCCLHHLRNCLVLKFVLSCLVLSREMWLTTLSDKLNSLEPIAGRVTSKHKTLEHSSSTGFRIFIIEVGLNFCLKVKTPILWTKPNH